MRSQYVQEIINLLHKWREQKIIQDEQLKVMLASEELKLPDPPEEPRPASHTKLDALFQTICDFVLVCSYNGAKATVLPADNPELRRFGWTAFAEVNGKEESVFCDIQVLDALNARNDQRRWGTGVVFGNEYKQYICKMLAQGINPLRPISKAET